MLSEDFDRKLRDAADHHHPAYDEKAWEKMRKLLDKHLPEKDDRRRRGFFFLLLFLLLGGGAAWILMGLPFAKKQEQAAAVSTTRPGDDRTSSNEINSSTNIVPDNPGESGTGKKAEPGTTAEDGTAAKQSEVTGTASGQAISKTDVSSLVKNTGGEQPVNTSLPGTRNRFIKQGLQKGNPAPATSQPTSNHSRKAINKQSNTVTPPAVDNHNEALTPVSGITAIEIPAVTRKERDEPVVTGKTRSAISGEEQNEHKAPVEKKDDAKTEDQPVEVKTSGKQPIKLGKKKSSLFFSVSGGPDVSYTGQDKMGRLKIFGGVGIGYNFRDKFFIRTGFYTARKMYTSTPGEYHAPAEFYTYYPNLQKVEADCKVYEIPVSLGYNFKGNDRHKFFIAAGLSTYLMKRETYNYYYKNYTTGPVVNRERTLYNMNDHYFSVINFSAGYQQKIGRRFSVIAEPYFKAPVGGIGFAKVNLISTGIQFSITASPFEKRVKKPGNK